MILSNRFFLSRIKMIRFLDTLQSANDTAGSLYISPGLSLPEIESLLKKGLGLQTVSQDMVTIISNSKTGAVLFFRPPRTNLFLPPFPITETHFTPESDIKPLRSLLEHDYKIALILVRLGAYAIGICKGESLIASKVGTGLVHGRHKKGGSSQQRFRRHREKQMEYFFSRACSHINEHFEPHPVDYAVYGGAWTTILLLQKQCPFLKRFDGHTLPPLLDIPDPRKATLSTSISRIWSSEVIEWVDD